MKSRTLGAVLTALALSAAPSGQSLQSAAGLGPVPTDFYFHENPDGSILVADSNGTQVFGDWQEYVQSPFFEEHGLRCGTGRLVHPLALGTTSDCSSSNTNPAAEYSPAGGADLVIPVVFHVLTRSNGTGNVSDALIESQIDVLNEDFGAFGGGAGGTDTSIQFVLAGITRTANNTWYNDGGTYYNSLAWDTTSSPPIFIPPPTP
jgi:hypothetical protein